MSRLPRPPAATDMAAAKAAPQQGLDADLFSKLRSRLLTYKGGGGKSGEIISGAGSSPQAVPP